MSEITAEEILATKGVYITTTSGISMLPLLRHKRDAVTIVPVTSAVKKYDVVLFRRGNQLVLHRVIKILPNGYIIRGDNCRTGEFVAPCQIIGTLHSFTRNGRTHTVTAPTYRAYSVLLGTGVMYRFCALWDTPRKVIRKIKGAR